MESLWFSELWSFVSSQDNGKGPRRGPWALIYLTCYFWLPVINAVESIFIPEYVFKLKCLLLFFDVGFI